MSQTALLSLTMVCLLSFTSFAMHSAQAPLSSQVLRVPVDYASIQDAVNSASAGDTIYVEEGTYYEHVVIAKSDLTLIGANSNNTTINGMGGDAVLLKANNIKITGFTLTQGYSGVQISPWTHGHVITRNVISRNDFGIRGHYDVHDIEVSNNTITANSYVGIELACYNSSITGNLISDTGKGLFPEISAAIEIVESVYNITISSDYNRIAENVIANNVNGIWPVRHSEGNLFIHNSFENNTSNFPIATPSLMNNNTVEENYWSDYKGEDSNGDGFGDSPYTLDANIQDSRPLMSPFPYWVSPLKGDVNRDMRVDIKDLAVAAQAFGAIPGYSNWNPNADVNKDDRVDMKDFVLVARNFGETYVADE